MHGFFEGIAIGLQNEYWGLLKLSTCVLLHKWAEALTLGISVVESTTKKRTYLLIMVLFSSTTPLGIVMGTILSNVSTTIDAVFTSMAAGTFLYLSVSDIVPEEFSGGKKLTKKFSFFVLGILLMTLLLIIEN